MFGTIVVVLILWFLISIPVSLVVARFLAAREDVYYREVRRFEARTGRRLPDAPPAFSSESPQVIF